MSGRMPLLLNCLLIGTLLSALWPFPVLAASPEHQEITCAVLNHLSLDIQPDATAAILGPNGAGKTSLLHVILGLLGFQFGANF